MKKLTLKEIIRNVLGLEPKTLLGVEINKTQRSSSVIRRVKFSSVDGMLQSQEIK